MYDLSKEFNKFYNEHTVLSIETKNELREKKSLNIERLKSGLEEYNSDNKTDYCLYDTKEQGSVAMSTVVQNDSNDYDIDVAIIFEENNIGNDIGTTTIKHIVEDALKRKCKSLKKEPESLTNCVRITYATGYHVDFAVYKKTEDDTYYHAGSTWQERNPMAINNWFKEEIKSKGERLRSVVRLSKMFCKSRKSWQMPGGLIQSVLCDECFADYERLDECFYYTIKNVAERLERTIEVYNPTDKTKSLLLKQSDRQKMNNWKQRLKNKLDKLDVLFEGCCSKKQAYDSWYTFFNHSFWQYSELLSESNSYIDVNEMKKVACNEEFIYNKYDIDISYSASIDCKVEANGFRPKLLSHFIKAKEWLPHKRDLLFYCETNTPKPFEVLWKVRNVGYIAEEKRMLRGEIIKSNKSNNMRSEHTDFYGPHFVECYIIKDNICVATARIDVPIE